jgi:hypothetical protein
LAAGVLLCALAAGAWWPWREVRVPPQRGAVDAACDLHAGRCSAVFAHGTGLELALDPRPITPEQALALRVRTSGAVPRQVWADFSGVHMNMGVQRARLVRRADGAWHGTATLPACPSGRMLWQVQVTVETGDALQLAAWRFEAGAP